MTGACKMKTRNRWWWNEIWSTVLTQTGKNLYKLNRLWLHWKYWCCSMRKGNLGDLQMFLGQGFRTEMPERLLPLMFLCWQQPQAVPAGSFELLPLTFYLSGNSWGYKMSSEVEICSAWAEIQGKHWVSTAKCLWRSLFPEEWENKYLKVLSEQFPEHRPCTSRARLN